MSALRNYFVSNMVHYRNVAWTINFGQSHAAREARGRPRRVNVRRGRALTCRQHARVVGGRRGWCCVRGSDGAHSLLVKPFYVHRNEPSNDCMRKGRALVDSASNDEVALASGRQSIPGCFDIIKHAQAKCTHVPMLARSAVTHCDTVRDMSNVCVSPACRSCARMLNGQELVKPSMDAGASGGDRPRLEA